MDPFLGSSLNLPLFYFRSRAIPADKSSLPHRPPVVTIMGHVDHGKTTLTAAITKVLDAATVCKWSDQIMRAEEQRSQDPEKMDIMQPNVPKGIFYTYSLTLCLMNSSRNPGANSLGSDKSNCQWRKICYMDTCWIPN